MTLREELPIKTLSFIQNNTKQEYLNEYYVIQFEVAVTTVITTFAAKS